MLQTIEDRRLEEQIDYVVYSSDFPWGITLDSDSRKFLEELPRSAPPPAPPPKEKSEGKPAEKPPAPRSSGPSSLAASARSPG